ncbi:putative amidoligase enzyme [Nitzschia inconspicua]|uniref:Amidoligase enzyme n=1 Tax=Nitzschia inconspicua TaxID=303405 RepID=A0A9K3KE31_9STRA|nr:putative amidoligase enzyme [Nitzschia inconspicua]
MTRQKVRYAVGNKYRKVPYKLAQTTKTGNKKKVHDWRLYVEVFGANKRKVKNVSFYFGGFLYPSSTDCCLPVPIRKPNGGLSWSFSSQRKSYAPVNADVCILFADGSKITIPHRVACRPGGSRSAVQTFTPFVEIPSEQCYGIELELTTMTDTVRLWELVHGNDADEIFRGWKIKPDNSIACSISQPDCNTFELVSPKLSGENGLCQIRSVLNALRQNNIDIKVNKSMGFHVHVEVAKLTQNQLNKICQNFVKYEDVFDSFLPSSRRSGSKESDRYFKSNRDHIGYLSNRERLQALEQCHDILSLASLMNPGRDRYFKLNLQNLVTKRQPTLEFRQHSATANFSKVAHWIRLCVLLVRSSANSPPPKPFSMDRSLEFQTYCLFKDVVKDLALKDYYLQRQQEIHKESCCSCDGCHDGDYCNQTVPKNMRRNKS